MKRFVTFAILLSVLSLSALADVADRMTDGFPDLPRDARKVAERYMACQHFWGEIGGSGDERDREVNAELRKLKCDRIELDLEKIKLKYRNKPEILNILKETDFSEAA